MTTSSLHLHRSNDNDLHGSVTERLAHARNSSAMMIEYLDEFAGELHPDFVAYFWQRIDEHVQRRLRDDMQG